MRPSRRALSAISVAVILMSACQSSASPAPSAVASSASVASQSAAPQSAAPSAPIASPSSTGAHWEPAGSTTMWRRDPHLLALANGRALVIGTFEPDSGKRETTAELWDPATGKWTATESLNKFRSSFAAVVLHDDLVLVAGGLNDDVPQQSYSSAYVYDGGSWIKTGAMGVARTAPSAARLPDGRVLVAGGYFHVTPSDALNGTPGIALADYHAPRPVPESAGPGLSDVDMGSAGAAIATAEVFDPQSGTWSPTGPMTYARTGAPAVTLTDGRVLIVGSSDSAAEGYRVDVAEHAFDTAEIYDPATGHFSVVSGRLPGIDRAALEKLGVPGANPMPDSDAFLIGGSLVALPDGGAVLIGATRYWKHAADMTQSLRFDARKGTWSEIGQTFVVVGEPGPVPLWRPGVPNLSGAMVASMAGGRVLVAGGMEPVDFSGGEFKPIGTSAAAQIYDPSTDTWSDTAPMPDPRNGGVAAVLSDGSVLLVGGTNEPAISDQVLLTAAVRFVP